MRGIFILFFTILSFSLSQPVQADCAAPAGIAGDQIFNSTHKTMQFCDGTNWYSMKGGISSTSFDVQVVSQAGTTSSSVAISAVCPVGYKLTGGGVSGVVWNSTVVESYPFPASETWMCSWRHGYGVSKMVTCYAICVLGL